MYRSLLAVFIAFFGTATAQAGVCETAQPSAGEKTNSQSFCVAEGYSLKFEFKTYPRVDTIRMFGQGCEPIELAPGRAVVDVEKLTVEIGPVLATGCYLIKWNEAL